MKKLKITAFFALLTALVTIVSLSAATYAWFTFDSTTYVTPLSGTVSKGGANLLISTRSDSGFAANCELPVSSRVLYPVTTSSLDGFYTAAGQSGGIVTGYAAANDRVNDYTLHGTVYLKAEDVGCDVYFWPAQLSFGTDAQTLAAMRLGIRFTTREGVKTYIFNLDSFGRTAGAAAGQTVAYRGTVVSGINGGIPVYVSDPAVSVTGYLATGESDAPVPGDEMLCALHANEVASVEYWLYLEGCDDNCVNAAQDRPVALQLGFAGVENDLD